jgi:hypothetical protein
VVPRFFRRVTRRREFEGEDRPDRTHVQSSESRDQPSPVAPAGVAVSQLGCPETPWWTPTAEGAPRRRASEGPADVSRPVPAHDATDEPAPQPTS